MCAAYTVHFNGLLTGRNIGLFFAGIDHEGTQKELYQQDVLANVRTAFPTVESTT